MLGKAGGQASPLFAMLLRSSEYVDDDEDH
jgi:hypothetical protein